MKRAWRNALYRKCSGGEEGGDFVERLDRNRDVRVSQSEFDGPKELFIHFDQSGDGYIEEDEAPQGPPHDAREFVFRLDKDGDERVSKEEFDGPLNHFHDFDQDGGGYRTEDESAPRSAA